MEEENIRVISSIIIPSPFDKKKFLLVKTAKDGKWGLVGGKVSPFENYKRAIAREAKEEIDIEIVTDYLVGIYWTKSARGHAIINHVFTGRIYEREPKINEKNKILEIAYLTLGEIRRLDETNQLRSKSNLPSIEDYLAGEKLEESSIVKEY